jgi:hypothetical protein
MLTVMGVLVAFLVIAVIAVVLVGAFGGFAVAARSESKQKIHEANAEKILNALFDGSPSVVYAAPDISGGLKIETLVRGANENGYRLVSETGQMASRRVVFERIT